MESLTLRIPTPLVELVDERISEHGVRLYLKRDDLIHPELPGNKWRKLKYNLEAARSYQARTLLTFGGAYSNHIRAMAAAGSYFGFRTIGVIRGEQQLPLNESLQFAVDRGMQLTYLDRATYRENMRPDVIRRLKDEFGDFYLVPEGGSNALAVPGCAELVDEINEPFDVICCPVGTGGTLAGVASALNEGQRAIGFSALKGGGFLRDDVAALQHEAFDVVTGDWSIETEFHFGGFAKRTAELDAFIADFADRHGVTLEWVYVAKMMFGVFELVRRGRFEAGTVIVAVVTG